MSLAGRLARGQMRKSKCTKETTRGEIGALMPFAVSQTPPDRLVTINQFSKEKWWFYGLPRPNRVPDSQSDKREWLQEMMWKIDTHSPFCSTRNSTRHATLIMKT